MTPLAVQGGHRLVLEGAPLNTLERLTPTQRLLVPRRHRFAHFSEIAVASGESVSAGQVLARGNDEMNFPVIAPVAATVGEITDDAVELILSTDSDWHTAALPPIGWESASQADLIGRVKDAGLWTTIHAAPDVEIPWRLADDNRTPAFVVISAVRGEPFFADPDVVLEHWKVSLAEVAAVVKKMSGAARVLICASPDLLLGDTGDTDVLELDERAPNDNVLAQCDAISRGSYAWGLDLQDAIAIRNAVVNGQLPTERVIALAGTQVYKPMHLVARVGTSIADVVRGRLRPQEGRVIHGGLLSGDRVDPETTGVGPWTRAVNALMEPEEREFMWFLRPGEDRDSFLSTFVGKLLPNTPKTAHGGIRGERRACVNCSACQWVCPVGLLPNMLDYYSNHDMVDDAMAMGLNRCIECGLCTYTCVSKIELMADFKRAKAEHRAEVAEERALAAQDAE